MTATSFDNNVSFCLVWNWFENLMENIVIIIYYISLLLSLQSLSLSLSLTILHWIYVIPSSLSLFTCINSIIIVAFTIFDILFIQLKICESISLKATHLSFANPTNRRVFIRCLRFWGFSRLFSRIFDPCCSIPIATKTNSTTHITYTHTQTHTQKPEALYQTKLLLTFVHSF